MTNANKRAFITDYMFQALFVATLEVLGGQFVPHMQTAIPSAGWRGHPVAYCVSRKEMFWGERFRTAVYYRGIWGDICLRYGWRWRRPSCRRRTVGISFLKASLFCLPQPEQSKWTKKINDVGCHTWHHWVILNSRPTQQIHHTYQ